VRAPQQGNLFGAPPSEVATVIESPKRRAFTDRLERVAPGLDRLRRKYGRNTVVPASLLGREQSRGGDGTTAEAGARVRDLDDE